MTTIPMSKKEVDLEHVTYPLSALASSSVKWGDKSLTSQSCWEDHTFVQGNEAAVGSAECVWTCFSWAHLLL